MEERGKEEEEDWICFSQQVTMKYQTMGRDADTSSSSQTLLVAYLLLVACLAYN
jgi:hypothetical protein